MMQVVVDAIATASQVSGGNHHFFAMLINSIEVLAILFYKLYTLYKPYDVLKQYAAAGGCFAERAQTADSSLLGGKGMRK